MHLTDIRTEKVVGACFALTLTSLVLKSTRSTGYGLNYILLHCLWAKRAVVALWTNSRNFLGASKALRTFQNLDLPSFILR